jgi:hypothetical protein
MRLLFQKIDVFGRVVFAVSLRIPSPNLSQTRLDEKGILER